MEPATPDPSATRVLVVGAYGLIGAGIVRRLLADWCDVVGMGRDATVARRVLPNISWIIADVATLCTSDHWAPHLRDISVVVNCSGALQDGPSDDLEALHHGAVSALAAACHAQDVRIIQISAVGANIDAETAFLASKARGDAAITASGVAFHILRPGLVLAPTAYGGSAMLRMLAAVPFVQPMALPDAQIQTVSLEDVARIVSAAVDGRLPNGFAGDIVEETPHRLQDVVAQIRNWFGFAPARYTVVFPAFAMPILCKTADALGYLGWRSPLRTTAVKVLTDGVIGRGSDLSDAGIAPLATLSQTLDRHPATAQDRLSARLALLTPLLIATMVLFWFASGAIGLLRVNVAAQTLTEVGWPYAMAAASVVFWAIVDIGIAVGFAVRRYAPLACWAAIGVSVFYLVASTLFVPVLWLDPLGPLVKVFPSIMLALVVRATLETR